MATYRNSRIIPIALVLIIVAVAIAALVSLARAVFFSGSTQSTTTQVDVSKEALVSSTADRSVRMTVRGTIVADEDFRSYQISVSPSSRSLTTFTGYLDKRIDGVQLSNNVTAYEEFVFALDRANLAKGTELSGDKNDIRGICATGLVYQFEILKDNSSVKTLWTSTCKGSRGSLDANLTQLTQLFTSQIPTANTLISKIRL